MTESRIRTLYAITYVHKARLRRLAPADDTIQSFRTIPSQHLVARTKTRDADVLLERIFIIIQTVLLLRSYARLRHHLKLKVIKTVA